MNSKCEKYRSNVYWQDRFAVEPQYEWLTNFDSIRHILTDILRPTDRILHIGCGNSRLSFDLYNAGYVHITNLDFAQSLIDERRISCAHDYPQMQWICADIRSSTIDDNQHQFDVIIEKAMLDSLLAAEPSPWCVSASASVDIECALTNIDRLLVDTGHFISISFAQPHFRMPLLNRWSIQVQPIGNWTFVYSMRKGVITSDNNQHRLINVSGVVCKAEDEDDENWLMMIDPESD